MQSRGSALVGGAGEGSSDGAKAELRREICGARAELGGVGEGSRQEGRETTAEGKEISGRGRGRASWRGAEGGR